MMTDEEFKKDFEHRYPQLAKRIRDFLKQGATGQFSTIKEFSPDIGEVMRYVKILVAANT
jgi:hypothetical protein